MAITSKLTIAVFTIFASFWGFNNLSKESNKKEIKDESPVAAFQGKLMKSADNGATWQNVDNGLPEGLTIPAFTVHNDHLYLGYSKENVYVNHISLSSLWHIENVDQLYFSAFDNKDSIVANFYTLDKNLYMSSRFGDIYKKQNDSDYWIPINKPEGVYNVMDIEEDVKGNLYLAGSYGLYISSDEGKNWKHISDYGDAYDVELNNDNIILSTINGIYKSKDYCKSWKQCAIYENHSMLNIRNQKLNYNYINLGNSIAAIRQDASFTKGASGKLQVTNDSGDTWQLHAADDYLKNLSGISKIISENGKLYCSYNEGIIKSEDGGKTWKELIQYNNPKGNGTLDFYVSQGVIVCCEKMFGC